VELWALRAGLLDALTPDRLPKLEQRLLESTQEATHLADPLRSARAVDGELEPELARWVQSAIPMIA
jgi:hypothetical protein